MNLNRLQMVPGWLTRWLRDRRCNSGRHYMIMGVNPDGLKKRRCHWCSVKSRLTPMRRR